MRKKEFSSERKEKMKRIRSGAEWVALVLLLAAFFIMFFDFHTYKEYNPKEVEMSDHGFLALAIPGVNRIQTENGFSEDDLSALLGKLKELGYVTVTQEDVRSYLDEGEELPDRSIFLIFQDGKRDTAALAQSLLEQYNFKATMLEAEGKDQKEQYLSERDKKTLKDNTYWEMGMDEDLFDKLDIIQTDPCWSVNHLLMELEVVHGEKEMEKTEQVPKEMELDAGYCSQQDNMLILTTNKKRSGRIWLDPENHYLNVHISAELCGNDNGTQKIGMRVANKNGIFVQVTGERLQLIERHNGVDEMVDEMDLENIGKNQAGGYQVNIRLNDTGITIYVNNRIAFNNTRIYVTEPGRIVFGVSSKIRGEKSEDVIYDAKFRNLTVSADGRQLYDGSLKWHQSLKRALKEWRRDFTAWVQQMD